MFGWFCIIFPPQALGTLKQKVRKYNKDFEKDIQSYRENPVTSDAEQASKLYLLNIACSIYMCLVITTQLKFIVGFLCKIKEQKLEITILHTSNLRVKNWKIFCIICKFFCCSFVLLLLLFIEIDSKLYLPPMTMVIFFGNFHYVCTHSAAYTRKSTLWVGIFAIINCCVSIEPGLNRLYVLKPLSLNWLNLSHVTV